MKVIVIKPFYRPNLLCNLIILPFYFHCYHHQNPFGHSARLGRPHHCQSISSMCFSSGIHALFALVLRNWRNTKHKINLVKWGAYRNSANFEFQDTGPRAGGLKCSAIQWSPWQCRAAMWERVPQDDFFETDILGYHGWFWYKLRHQMISQP
jgi:hypothetical protein